MTLTAALLAVLLLVLLLWCLRPQRLNGFPPGPTILHLREIIWAVIETSKGGIATVLGHFRQKYGDIFGFILPSGLKIIHILNFDDIKDASALPQLSGRPNVFSFMVRNHQQRLGISYNEGAGWSEHRRFVLHHIRTLGFGGHQLETIVVDELEHMISDMLPNCGKPVDIKFHLDLAATNVVWRMIASQRFDSSCLHGRALMAMASESFRALGPQNPTNVAPWLRYVVPEWSGHAALVRYRDSFDLQLRELIKQHQQTLDPSRPRDFIDQFLIKMDSSDAETQQFSERNLTSIAMDLFEAGLTTTSLTLLWAFLLLVLHPDVQTRVHQEIDSALGGRMPSYSDRGLLPYTEATLLEVSRRVSVIPQAVPHSALTDVTFRGLTIPKNTIVLLHLWSVHMDPEYWGDPEAFRPERFLTADGNFRNDERVIPFGLGKRMCLGGGVARMKLFVLFTRMLKRFRFTADPEQALTLETSFFELRRPQKFHVKYEPRN